MGNQQVTDCDLAWLAGVWDGLGWVSLKPKRANTPLSDGGVNLRIGIVNTDVALINRVDQILTDMAISHHISEHAHDAWRTRYDIEIGRFASATMLIEALLPHLTAKRGQAELLLRFLQRQAGLAKNAQHTAVDLAIVDECHRRYARPPGTSTTERETASLQK